MTMTARVVVEVEGKLAAWHRLPGEAGRCARPKLIVHCAAARGRIGPAGGSHVLVQARHITGGRETRVGCEEPEAILFDWTTDIRVGVPHALHTIWIPQAGASETVVDIG